MHKVHYERVTSEPNESDTEGYSDLACGQDFAERMSTDKAAVTCKRCLREIAKLLAAQPT